MNKELILINKAGYSAVIEEKERQILLNGNQDKKLINAIKYVLNNGQVKSKIVKIDYMIFEIMKTNDGVIIYLFVPHKQYNINGF